MDIDNTTLMGQAGENFGALEAPVKKSHLWFAALTLLTTTSPAGGQDAAPAATPAYEFGYRNSLNLPSPITFEAGSDKLTPSSDAALSYVATYLANKSYVTLMRVEGHVAGDVGAGADELSQKRAMAAAKALVAKGVDCKRLMAVGFGASMPVADGSTPEGRAQNTRVSVHNVELRGKSIGGLPTDGGGRVAGDVCKP